MHVFVCGFFFPYGFSMLNLCVIMLFLLMSCVALFYAKQSLFLHQLSHLNDCSPPLPPTSVFATAATACNLPPLPTASAECRFCHCHLAPSRLHHRSVSNGCQLPAWPAQHLFSPPAQAPSCCLTTHMLTWLALLWPEPPFFSVVNWGLLCSACGALTVRLGRIVGLSWHREIFCLFVAVFHLLLNLFSSH